MYVSDELFYKLYDRQGDYCACDCGKRLYKDGRTHVDHKIPVSRYGRRGNPDNLRNLQLLDATCNRQEGDMTMPEFRRWKKQREW